MSEVSEMQMEAIPSDSNDNNVNVSTSESDDDMVGGISSDEDWDCSIGLEWYQAAFSMVVVVIGAGVMALPQLPTKGGLVTSFIIMVACAATITESGLGMWKGIMAGNGSKKNTPGMMKIVSYEDFGRTALGEPGEIVVVVVQVFFYLGIAASFSVLIADAVSHLSRGWLSPKEWLLPLFPLFALMSLLPNVSAVAKLVPLAVFCVVALCSLIVLKSAMDSQRWQEWPDIQPGSLHHMWPTKFMDVGSVVATCFGAFGVNGNVPSILCEMKDQRKFPLAFKTAMTTVFVIYAAVMGVGYWGYGQFIQPDIVKSLTSFPDNYDQALHVPYKQWTDPKAKALEYILSSLLLVKLLVGLPLNLMVIFYSLQTFKYTRNYVPAGTWANKAMRVVIVALALAIARAVTNFGTLFALVCSVFGPLMQCLMPLAFSYLIRKNVAGRPSSAYRRVLHSGLCMVALFTLTIGFWDSLQPVIHPKAAA